MKRRRTTKTSDAEEPMDTTEDKTPVTLSSERYHITSPYWSTKVSSNSEIRISCVSNSSLKRRGLMSRYYGRNFFFISTIFLDRDGHLHCRTMEKRMGYRFVSVCNLAQEGHTWQLSRFFSAIFTGTRLLRSRNFATMATWRNDLSILDGILLKKCLVFNPGLCYRHRLRSCQS